MMGIIKTDEQYEEALALVEELMDLNPEGMPMTLKMIRHLYQGPGIPAEVLIREPGTVDNGKLISSNKDFSRAKKVASPKARYDRTS